MNATESRIEDFLQTAKTQFIIPIYQRQYRWETSHCKQLLDDIVEIASLHNEDAHFIGSIVYVADSIYTSSKMKKLSIVDGQQRLTTLFIVYLVIYRIAVEMGDESLADDMYENYLTNKTAPDNNKLKLQTDENNMSAIKFLIRGEGGKFVGKSRIIDNFNFFKRHINKDNMSTVLDGLLKIAFVEVSLDRERDNPQKIFESLNSTGLDLSQDDLIRNYILMSLAPEQQEVIYEDYWEHIDILAHDETKNESKLFDFMKAYLTGLNNRTPHNNKVYKDFKSSFVFSDYEDLECKLKPIKNLVGFYNKITNPQNETDREIRIELNYIKQLDVGVVNPFLMKVYEDYANQSLSKSDFISLLHTVQSYIIRRFIVSLATNALNKMFMSLYDKIDKDNYLESLQEFMITRKSTLRFPKDKEVIDTLKYKDVYNSSSKSKLYLLDRMENFNNKEPVYIMENPDITIEHIFPQTPNSEWSKNLLTTDYELFKETYLHTLSNLTLSGNNGNLGNREFIFKRDLPEKGYKASRLWLNKYLAQQDEWDIQALNERHDILADRFLQIWKFPDVETKCSSKDHGEINVFDIDDATHQRIDYYIFSGETTHKATHSGMYTHVLKKLMEINGELLISLNATGKISIHVESESERLRAPSHIGEGYYIDTNKNANAIIKSIKWLLRIFELDDALYVRYQDGSLD